MDVTSLELQLDYPSLLSSVRRAWPVRDVSLPPAPSGRVLVEWWRVNDAQFRIGTLAQKAVYRSMGALFGGFSAMLSTRAVTAPERAFAEGARSGAVRAERVHDAVSRSLGNYQELVVLVPGLRVRGVEASASYIAAMLTDSAYARAADVALGFGMDKRPATFVEDADAKCVRDSRGAELLRAHFTTTDGAPRPASWDSIALGRVGGIGVLSRLERARPASVGSQAFTLAVNRALGGVLPIGLYRGVARQWLRVPTQLRVPHHRFACGPGEVAS